MKIKKTVEIELYRCDFCGEEVKDVMVCGVCGREGCYKDGGKEHFAYSLEIYRYGDGERNPRVQVCKECTRKQPHPAELVFGQIFDRMVEEIPVM